VISADSRYAQSTVIPVQVKKDIRFVIVPSEQQAYTFSYQFYLVVAGDRIDNIAYQFYGDPLRWWVIADANPQIMDWSVLIPGELIRVPVATT
jgi:nucleoid-associated protein YgaU